MCLNCAFCNELMTQIDTPCFGPIVVTQYLVQISTSRIENKMISKSEAIKIVESYIQDKKGYSEVSDVYSFEEIRGRKPVLYVGEGKENTDYWIVYVTKVRTKDWILIESSTVALVCRETGSLDFFGTACDEG